MWNNNPSKHAAVMLGLALVAGPSGRAAETDDLAQLREQLRTLEQKILILARKQEIQTEADQAAAKVAPKISLTDKGFTLASGDGANSVRRRGLVQLDSRNYFGDDGTIDDTFILRRARLISEGVLAKHWSFQLVTEFGGSSVGILDANLGLKVSDTLQLKFGKFKVPVGLEQLQSDTWTLFNERSIATNLAPNRDLGIEASGRLVGGKVNYALGVFNGVADGGSSTNTDFDSDKDLAGRVVVTPFKWLSLGLAGSIGRQKTAAGRPARYRTDGQQSFFAYNSAVVADGVNWRWSPQLDYRSGPFGLLAEYIVSTINVRPAATGAKAELQNRSWQVATGWVLTGEDSSYGGVVPRTNFDPAAGTWGAFELTARVAQVDVDDGAFPHFASVAGNASRATSLGFGLNWYFSKAAAAKLDYYQTGFGFAPGAPAVPTAAVLRQDERVFISRIQLSF